MEQKAQVGTLVGELDPHAATKGSYAATKNRYS